MVKKEKGVTLVTLVITIILLGILAGVSANTGYSVIKDMRIGRIIANMTLVRAKVETIYEQYQFSEEEEDLVGTKVTEIDFLSEEEKKLIEEKAGNTEFANLVWYEWNANDLRSQGLDVNLLGNDEKFYINYENSEIIYSKGTAYRTKIKYYSMTGLNYIYINNQ